MATPRKRQSRTAPTRPEPERTVETVKIPPSEKVELTVETPVPQKYEPKEKVGAPYPRTEPQLCNKGWTW